MRLLDKLALYATHRLDEVDDVRVCADWFEEQGDPFADALRVAVESVDVVCGHCRGRGRLRRFADSGRVIRVTSWGRVHRPEWVEEACPHCGGKGRFVRPRDNVWRFLGQALRGEEVAC